MPKHFSDSPFCHFKEDILGGHSAVGNITLRILNDLACQEKGLKTQEQIQVWLFFVKKIKSPFFLNKLEKNLPGQNISITQSYPTYFLSYCIILRFFCY